MISKKYIFDNLNGGYMHIAISSGNDICFIKNEARVKIYDLLSEDISNVLDAEYFSSKLIKDSKQSNTSCFFIPIGKSKYVLDLQISGCLEEDIEGLIVKPI